MKKTCAIFLGGVLSMVLAAAAYAQAGGGSGGGSSGGAGSGAGSSSGAGSGSAGSTGYAGSGTAAGTGTASAGAGSTDAGTAAIGAGGSSMPSPSTMGASPATSGTAPSMGTGSSMDVAGGGSTGDAGADPNAAVGIMAAGSQPPSNAQVIGQGSIVGIDREGSRVTIRDASTGRFTTRSVRDSSALQQVNMGDSVQIFRE